MSNDRTENNISPLATSLHLTDHEFTYIILSSLGIIVAGGGYALYRSAQDGRSFQLPEYREVDPYTAHSSDGDIQALVKRGYASIDEILEAAFGEWPVKGLNIVSTNPQEVFFENFTGDVAESRPGRLAEATVHNSRIIRTQSNIVNKDGLAHTIAHEATHIHQGDNTYRADDIYSQGAFSENNISRDAQMSMGENDPARKIFEQYENTKLTSQLEPEISEHLNYLSSGAETQARIQEILIEGYQRWGQLPSSPEEFYSAMENSGFDIPDKIIKQFESSPTWQKTQEIFAKTSAPEIRAVSDINTVIDYLKPSGKVAFWDMVMPTLYVDLIEMFGDKQGRARFGLGENPRPAAKTQKEIDNYRHERSALENETKGHAVKEEIAKREIRYKEEAENILKDGGRSALRKATEEVKALRVYTQSKVWVEEHSQNAEFSDNERQLKYRDYALEAQAIISDEGVKAESLAKQSAYHNYSLAIEDYEYSRNVRLKAPDKNPDYDAIQSKFDRLYSQGGVEAVRKETFYTQFRKEALETYISDIFNLRRTLTQPPPKSQIDLTDDIRKFDMIFDKGGLKGVEEEIRRIYVNPSVLSVYGSAQEALKIAKLEAKKTISNIEQTESYFAFDDRHRFANELLSRPGELREIVETDVKKTINELRTLNSDVAAELQGNLDKYMQDPEAKATINPLDITHTITLDFMEDQPHPSEINNVDIEGHKTNLTQQKLRHNFQAAANETLPIPDNITSINNAQNITPINKKVTVPDVEKVAASVSEITAMVDDVKAARVEARALKFGKLGFVSSAAVTVGVAGLLKHSFSTQRDLAGHILDGKALEAYQKLNQEMENMMLLENFGAQGLVFLLSTPAVEAAAQEKFKEFSDKFHLSPEQHEMLGMSMFDRMSSQEKFAKEVMYSLPKNRADCPPELQKLWDTREDIISLKMPARGSKFAWEAKMGDAKEAYNAEFKNVITDPSAAKMLIAGVPAELKLEIIALTARSENNGLHPEIQLLADLQEQLSNTPGSRSNVERRADLRQAIADTKESLTSQEGVLDQYAAEYFDNLNTQTDKPDIQTADLPPIIQPSFS